MQQGAESTQERSKRLRGLNEGEKLSLIFTQQRQLSELEGRLEAFQCSHQTGQCPLCRDKDLVIAQLQQQIEQLKNKLFGRSSERRGKGKDKNPPQGGGNPKKNTERTRLPSEQFPNARVQEVTIEDPKAPKCPECKDLMTDSGLREIAERIEYQPAELYILRTKRVRYGCKCCETPPVTADLPARLAPQTSLGDSFLIQATLSKFYDLIPTTRFAKILARGHTAVSEGLLRKAQSVMAVVLLPVYNLIKIEVQESRVIFADETIHRQLEDNNGNWRWYLWAFCTRTSIYFEVHDTRAGDVSIEFIMESAALFLVSDAYSGYSRTIREVNEVRQPQGKELLQSCLCNDHARRYWYRAQPGALVEKILDLYEKIYKIEEEVQELLRLPKYLESENSAQALKLRQTADPLFNEIHVASCEVLLEAPENSPEAVAARYFLNNVEGLTLYLRHIELPVSNSFTERAIRDHVLLRKVSLGNHSQPGAQEAAIQLSIMCTCKLLHLNPTEFLEFISARHKAQEPLLTPYQYLKYKESLKKENSSEKPPDTS